MTDLTTIGLHERIVRTSLDALGIEPVAIETHLTRKSDWPFFTILDDAAKPWKAAILRENEAQLIVGVRDAQGDGGNVRLERDGEGGFVVLDAGDYREAVA
jgi:hypothetical protein